MFWTKFPRNFLKKVCFLYYEFMKNWEIVQFSEFADKRGTLVPFEFDKDFPIDVKRTYLVTGTEGSIRGGHSHKIESEIFIASSGTIKAIIHDGQESQEISLDSRAKGLVVRPGCWHEFISFSSDAVMLCFSSTHYLPGESNYVTDRNLFFKD